jgi:hypothetical protein
MQAYPLIRADSSSVIIRFAGIPLLSTSLSRSTVHHRQSARQYGIVRFRSLHWTAQPCPDSDLPSHWTSSSDAISPNGITRSPAINHPGERSRHAYTDRLFTKTLWRQSSPVDAKGLFRETAGAGHPPADTNGLLIPTAC